MSAAPIVRPPVEMVASVSTLIYQLEDDAKRYEGFRLGAVFDAARASLRAALVAVLARGLDEAPALLAEVRRACALYEAHRHGEALARPILVLVPGGAK